MVETWSGDLNTHLSLVQMINFMRDQGVSKLMPVVDPDVEYEVKYSINYLVLNTNNTSAENRFTSNTLDTLQWAAFNGGLSAGYIMRAEPVVPKMDTSGKAPWFGGGGSCSNL